MFINITILLFIILLAGCVLITQPTISRNKPSKERVDPEKLRGHVIRFSETFYPRNYRKPENLTRCVAYIREHFETAGAFVEIQEFRVKSENQVYQNVIARFIPEGREQENPIVVGAHYDSFGSTPGADDNASGMAGLIELAYLLGKNKEQMQCPVELVAYCLEEPPFFASGDMGSARHAQLMKAEGRKPRIMICLEMIGTFYDQSGSQKFPMPLFKLYYPKKGNFIAVVGKSGQGTITRKVKAAMKGATPLPVYSINGPTALPGIGLSDHRNYWEEGWKAVMITDTAFFRNDRYHQSDETADKLDYTRMSQVVVGVYEAVVMLGSEE